MTSAPYRFDPAAIFAVLNEADVEYIVIGGIAATLHGSSVRTGDSDICPDTESANLVRLTRALEGLDCTIRTGSEHVPFPVSPELLASAATWNLSTKYGDLDIAFEPSGTSGYLDLVQQAVTYDLDGVLVRVAALEDVIRSKQAANRAKDREHLVFLRALLEEKQ